MPRHHQTGQPASRATIGHAGSRANQLSRLTRAERPGTSGCATGAPWEPPRPFWRARSRAVVTRSAPCYLGGAPGRWRACPGPDSLLPPGRADLGTLWGEDDPGGAGLERHRVPVPVDVVGELVQVRLGPGARRGGAAAARAPGEHLDGALADQPGAGHRGPGRVAHHGLL